MTPKERYSAVLHGQVPDMVPIRVGNYNTFICQYYKISINQYLEDPGLNAELFVQFLSEFGIDSGKAGLGYILYGCGPEMGPEWNFPKDQFPSSIKGMIHRMEDIDSFAVPEKPSGYFKNFLEINRRVKDEIGDKIHLGVSILGPFSAAVFLRGFEEILIDTIDNMEFFNRLLTKAEDVTLFIGEHCLKLDLDDANLLEIFLVPGVVSPQLFHEQIEVHDESVCRRLSDPPLANFASAFMGPKGDREGAKKGKLFYDYYFGTGESIEQLKSISNSRIPGFPHLVSISGKALVNWSIDQILDYLRNGLNHFRNERGVIPSIFLASVQASNHESAIRIAKKIKAIHRFREKFNINKKT